MSKLPAIGTSSLDIQEIQVKNAEFLKEKIKEASESLKGLADSLGKEKTNKTVTNMKKMFTSMIEAGPQAVIIEGVMKLIKPFLALFELMTPIFDALGGIIQMALIPIMQDLMPVIQLVIALLMENKDIIIMLIQLALLPLMVAIKFLSVLFIQNQDVIRELFEAIKPLIQILMDMITWVTDSEDAMFLMTKAAEALGFALRIIVDTIHIVNDAISKFIGWINDLIAAAQAVTGGGGSKKKKKAEWWEAGYKILGLQGGGAVKANPPFGTVIRAGEREDEFVIPKSKLGGSDPETIYLLERQRDLLLMLYQQKADENR